MKKYLKIWLGGRPYSLKDMVFISVEHKIKNDDHRSSAEH